MIYDHSGPCPVSLKPYPLCRCGLCGCEGRYWLCSGFTSLRTASDEPANSPALGSLFLCLACPTDVWEGSERGSARDTGLGTLLCLHHWLWKWDLKSMRTLCTAAQHRLTAASHRLFPGCLIPGILAKDVVAPEQL